MAYLVKLMARAQRDLIALYEHINVEESAPALRWYEDLKRAILSLEELPNRCPFTPEDRHVRHLLFGHKPHVYRVIYRVIEKKKRVEVLHIRHSARRGLKRRDLF